MCDHAHNNFQDVTSLVVQGVGGAMAAMADTLESANRVRFPNIRVRSLY